MTEKNVCGVCVREREGEKEGGREVKSWLNRDSNLNYIDRNESLNINVQKKKNVKWIFN